jgi:hypothetical protein
MSGIRVIPPSAAALIGSFRGVGYSLETALADLIDNSISAGAATVDIVCEWNDGDPIITIADDGIGMAEGQLIEAMRFGGIGPDAARGENDLGRFGLGLKTASFSQCRCLSVFSKTASATAVFTWDLDEIRRAEGAWHLLVGGSPLPENVDAQLQSRDSGTVVAWRKVDFGRKTDRPDYHTFMGDLERTDRHLGMIFHRFIDGDARRVVLKINGHVVKAWDPFLETHQATIPLPEKYFESPGGLVRAKGFVLPTFTGRSGCFLPEAGSASAAADGGPVRSPAVWHAFKSTFRTPAIRTGASTFGKPLRAHQIRCATNSSCLPRMPDRRRATCSCTAVSMASGRARPKWKRSG